MRKRFRWAALYILTIGLLSNVVALFIRRDKLDPNHRFFRLRQWEQGGKIYDRIAIRKWKGRVPDVSRTLRFVAPKKVTAATDEEGLSRLIRETCVAELVHVALMVLSLAVLWICPGWQGVLLYGLCFFGNLPFICIQRYNRPQYMLAAERLARRKERLHR